jgi:hydroxyacylglutathione hydrolase
MLAGLTRLGRRMAKVGRAIIGPLQTNCYLLGFTDHTVIVDPAGDAAQMVGFLTSTNPKKLDIYLTHGHYDHIGAVPDLCAAFPDARIFASKLDLELYTDPALNLSAVLGSPFDLKSVLDKMIWVDDGQTLTFGNAEVKIIALPGHSPGSTGLILGSDNMIFVGDTLFYGSVGNTELPRASFPTMMKSIITKLMSLPDKFIVLPGHGDPTSIGQERKTNPFLLEEMQKAEKSAQ